MTLDLVVLGIVAFAAIFGFFKGLARQVGAALGTVAAWFAAGPSGHALGATVAVKARTSLTIGTVLASIAAFLLVYLVVQVISAAIIRRLLAGRDPHDRGVDRALGFLLGGAKMASIVFVVLCGLTFFESNVVVAGRHYTFTPRDSVAAGLARRWNVLERLQFSGVKDLVKVAKLQGDPQAAGKLKDDPDFSSLTKDPRFKQALSAEGMRRALESGDLRALFANNAVIELIQDPEASRRLQRLGDRSGW